MTERIDTTLQPIEDLSELLEVAEGHFHGLEDLLAKVGIAYVRMVTGEAPTLDTLREIETAIRDELNDARAIKAALESSNIIADVEGVRDALAVLEGVNEEDARVPGVVEHAQTVADRAANPDIPHAIEHAAGQVLRGIEQAITDLRGAL